MITVKELAKKLRDYANQSPEHASTEVMLAYDGNVSYPFNMASDTTAMSQNGSVRRFLVFEPEFKGDKLELKPSSIHH